MGNPNEEMPDSEASVLQGLIAHRAERVALDREMLRNRTQAARNNQLRPLRISTSEISCLTRQLHGNNPCYSFGHDEVEKTLLVACTQNR